MCQVLATTEAQISNLTVYDTHLHQKTSWVLVPPEVVFHYLTLIPLHKVSLPILEEILRTRGVRSHTLLGQLTDRYPFPKSE